jgi:uncharacterized membrane protein HdeD (DUF308 family)
MNELLSKSWRGLAVRGTVSVLFGILVALWPGLTLVWLIVMFAAYAVIGGLVSVTTAVQNRKGTEGWWLVLLLGLVSIGAGGLAIMLPHLTALVLVLLIGATALTTGILDIAMAVRLREVIHGEGLLFLNGFVSVMFGISVFFFPGAGALALAWLISIYAIITGGLLLLLAWRARSWKNPDEAWPDGIPHSSG